MKPITLLFLALLIILEGSSWAESDWKVLTPANSPPARFGHSTTPLPDGKILLFGGEGNAQELYNDLHAYDNGQWTLVTPANPAPPARRSQCAWYANGKI